MQVGRRDIGGQAIMVLSVDKPVTADVVTALETLEEVRSVTEIDL